MKLFSVITTIIFCSVSMAEVLFEKAYGYDHNGETDYISKSFEAGISDEDSGLSKVVKKLMQDKELVLEYDGWNAVLNIPTFDDALVIDSGRSGAYSEATFLVALTSISPGTGVITQAEMFFLVTISYDLEAGVAEVQYKKSLPASIIQ